MWGEGGDFKPHILTIDTAEDIIGRIKSFTQNGLRAICVLSANGTVSNVKIQLSRSNNRILTFEGAYEILSLNGSVVITERGGVRNVREAWWISFGGVNNCVFGGCIAGGLVAASPVQVVIGTFCPLISNPSVHLTPTIPNTLDFTSTGQVHRPEMRNPSPYLNQEWYGSTP